MDNYLDKHILVRDSKKDQIDEEFTEKVMYRTIYHFNGMDRDILLSYMRNIPNKDIAEKYNISPSAVSQRIKILLEDYRIMLCNDHEFKKTKRARTLKWESEIAFRNYIEEVRKTKT